MTVIDRTNRRYGSLVAISFVGMDNNKHPHAKWLCNCDCGKSKVVSAHNLTNKHTISCGACEYLFDIKDAAYKCTGTANGAKPCQGCGTLVNGKQQQRCSECKYKRQLSRARENYRTLFDTPTPRPCKICETTFDSMYPNALICSDKCDVVNKQIAKELHRARRRSRQLGNGRHEAVSMAKVLSRDNGICYLCEKAVDVAARVPDGNAATVDHVIPLAKGGTHTYDNVKIAHFRCNCKKGDKVLVSKDAKKLW